MFEKKQNQGMDLCLTLINPRVLYENNCIFFPHNAATASYRNVPIANLQGKKAFEALFAQEITYQKSGREPQSIWRSSSLLDCETTLDQAEVQCLEMIDPDIFLVLCVSLYENNAVLDFIQDPVGFSAEFSLYQKINQSQQSTLF